MGYNARYATYQQMVEQALDRAIPIQHADWPEQTMPKMLGDAMRYSLLAGGKRLRPVLLLAAYNLLHNDVMPALPFAMAVEMIHTYSLIHDDLPAMDDDDLRRGKPTSHKVYGEAMAILAGDALLNMAYETMAHSGHANALAALAQIAARAGGRGMIAGQTADIAMEGKPADEHMLRYIHQHKTADLIAAALLGGLALAGANHKQLALGEQYSLHLGLAFQIVDDLLDLEGEQQLLGKHTGQDAGHGKLTWPAVYGVQAARQDAARHIDTAVTAANGFGEQGQFLAQLALNSLKRVQ